MNGGAPVYQSADFSEGGLGEDVLSEKVGD